MSIPTILGFPVWRGKIKRRVAKKHLGRCRWFLKAGDLSKLTVGDYINDCTAYNGKILSLRPEYYSIGRGQILVDVDIQTENTGCSLISCGIQPALSREYIEQVLAAYLRESIADPENHYGDLERDRRKLAVMDAGGHICDERGCLLPEFRK